MSDEKEILSWNNVLFYFILLVILGTMFQLSTKEKFQCSEIEIEWLVTYPSVCAQIPTRPIMKQEIFRFPQVEIGSTAQLSTFLAYQNLIP